jgi:hypothetical protein
MTLSKRIAVAGATIAVAVAGSAPALATSMTHWSKAECKAYAKKYDKAMGMKMSNDNKTLKDHGCSEKVK